MNEIAVVGLIFVLTAPEHICLRMYTLSKTTNAIDRNNCHAPSKSAYRVITICIIIRYHLLFLLTSQAVEGKMLNYPEG